MKSSFKAQVLSTNSQFNELLTLWLLSGEPNRLSDFASDRLLMEAGLLPWPPQREGVAGETDVMHKIKNAFALLCVSVDMLLWRNSRVSAGEAP